MGNVKWMKKEEESLNGECEMDEKGGRIIEWGM